MRMGLSRRRKASRAGRPVNPSPRVPSSRKRRAKRGVIRDLVTRLHRPIHFLPCLRGEGRRGGGVARFLRIKSALLILPVNLRPSPVVPESPPAISGTSTLGLQIPNRGKVRSLRRSVARIRGTSLSTTLTRIPRQFLQIEASRGYTRNQAAGRNGGRGMGYQTIKRLTVNRCSRLVAQRDQRCATWRYIMAVHTFERGGQ